MLLLRVNWEGKWVLYTCPRLGPPCDGGATRCYHELLLSCVASKILITAITETVSHLLLLCYYMRLTILVPLWAIAAHRPRVCGTVIFVRLRSCSSPDLVLGGGLRPVLGSRAAASCTAAFSAGQQGTHPVTCWHVKKLVLHIPQALLGVPIPHPNILQGSHPHATRSLSHIQIAILIDTTDPRTHQHSTLLDSPPSTRNLSQLYVVVCVDTANLAHFTLYNGASFVCTAPNIDAPLTCSPCHSS